MLAIVAGWKIDNHVMSIDRDEFDRVSLECGKSGRAKNSRCSSTAQHDGFKQSPHTFSWENFPAQ
jgi:hypothetical protein